MTVRDEKLDCVVCKNCIRAFDINYDDIRGNVKVIEKREETNGWDNQIFEAECPYCFSKEVYNQMEDARWGETLDQKLVEAYKHENELLRKRSLKQEERIEKFEKETARLRKENKNLADILHKIKEAGKGQQLEEQIADEPSAPLRLPTASTSHNRYIT